MSLLLVATPPAAAAAPTTPTHPHLLLAGVNVVGRDLTADVCLFETADASVSRKHARLVVTWVGNGAAPPHVEVIDDSSNGTKVNGVAIKKGEPFVVEVATPTRATQTGSVVQFGQGASRFKVEWRPLVVCATQLDKTERAAFAEACRAVMAISREELDADVTHLVTSDGSNEIKTTAKILSALASRVPIFRLAWLRDLASRSDPAYRRGLAFLPGASPPPSSLARYVPELSGKTRKRVAEFVVGGSAAGGGHTAPSQFLDAAHAANVAGDLAVRGERAVLFDGYVAVVPDSGAASAAAAPSQALATGDVRLWILKGGGVVLSPAEFAKAASGLGGKKVFAVRTGAAAVDATLPSGLLQLRIMDVGNAVLTLAPVVVPDYVPTSTQGSSEPVVAVAVAGGGARAPSPIVGGSASSTRMSVVVPSVVVAAEPSPPPASVSVSTSTSASASASAPSTSTKEAKAPVPPPTTVDTRKRAGGPLRAFEKRKAPSRMMEEEEDADEAEEQEQPPKKKPALPSPVPSEVAPPPAQPSESPAAAVVVPPKETKKRAKVLDDDFDDGEGEEETEEKKRPAASPPPPPTKPLPRKPNKYDADAPSFDEGAWIVCSKPVSGDGSAADGTTTSVVVVVERDLVVPELLGGDAAAPDASSSANSNSNSGAADALPNFKRFRKNRVTVMSNKRPLETVATNVATADRDMLARWEKMEREEERLAEMWGADASAVGASKSSSRRGTAKV